MTSELPGPEIRTFLIADVRGYTLFTQERGDEAAAKLATKFATIAREEISERGGEVIELRGDEALAVFGSARQAIRAAIGLQERFVDETLADAEIPLPVGIGLDAGEAVAVEGGYRGGALNLAARLCGRAGPGEILASREVTHLARHIDGVRYVDRGAHELKGMAEPVTIVKIELEENDPALRLRPMLPVQPARRRRWIPRTMRSRLVAAVVALALIAGGIFVVTRGGENEGLSAIAPNAIGLIDATSGAITESVPIAVGRGGLAAGDGAVWAAGPRAGTVLRIDPSSRAVVDTIDLSGDASGIAAAGGAVWVSIGDEGTVDRINAAANEVVGSPHVGNAPAGIAVGFDSVWVANRVDGTVSRIDATTGAVGDPIAAGAGATGVAVAAGAVWVTNAADGTVTRIEPSTGDAAPIRVGNGPGPIAGSGDVVWVANTSDGTVSRIDPARRAVVATVEVGEGPVGLALAGGNVWVASEFAGTVSRIDPASNTVVDVLEVGGTPQGITAVGGSVWVATGPASGSHRGGTFTLVSESDVDSLDPAYAYAFDTWQMLLIVHDGLVGHRRLGGQAGASLVPDLATALPEPTDGGTTYTFTLRRGIQYSTRGEVRASDVRASIERVLTARPASPGVFAFESIVGAATCGSAPADCDLSEGIVVSDEAATVTFHLTKPDPDFLYKISLPFASVLPADAPPARMLQTASLPATGPYVVESYRAPTPEGAEGRIELARNPRFEEWSPAAQPAGNPDRIVRRTGLEADQTVDLVRAGEADYMIGSPPADRLGELRTLYTDRLRSYPSTVTLGLGMNTRVAPFDDVNVRRAVNYAMDRGVAAEFLGESRVTCQILPPNFPGYRPYCPYTRDPDAAGVWTAPDVSKARQLIEISGAAGSAVTVWALRGDMYDFAGLGRYMVTVLRDLGFRVKLRIAEDPGKHFEMVADSRTRAQIFAVGWGQDYAAASNFLDQLFSCRAFRPADRGQFNFSELCDRDVDALIDRAFELQVADPTAAGDAWAEVDRAVVDLAAWAPIANEVGIDFLSERVSNYQHHPQYGLLLSQVSVR